MNKKELKALYDTRQSFYNKAYVLTNDQGDKTLFSYSTPIITLDKDNYITSICIDDVYSQTTIRHLNEFLQQNGHDKTTKKEIQEIIDKHKIK